MKEKLKRNGLLLLSVLVGMAALVFIHKQISFDEAFRILGRADISLFFLLLFITVLIQLTLSWRWLVVLQSQGYKGMNIFKLTLYRLAGFAVGFLTPTAKLGGEPVKAAILSKRENIPFKKSLSGVAIDKTIDLSSAGLFFVIGVVVLLFQESLVGGLRNLAIAAAVFLLIITLFFNYRMIRGKYFFLPFFRFLGLHKHRLTKEFIVSVKSFESLIIKFYHKDKMYFFYTLLISLLSWALMFAEYRIAGHIVGIELGLVEIFLIFSLVGASYMVPIPMALGVLEAGQAGIFKALGFTATAGLSLALLIRLRDVLLSLIGLALMVFFGFKIRKVMKESYTGKSRRKKR